MKISEYNAEYYALKAGWFRRWFWGVSLGERLYDPRESASGYVGIKSGDTHIGNYLYGEIVSSFDKEPVNLIPNIATGILGEVGLFRDKIYVVSNKKEHYDDEKTRLLILEHIDKERRKFESLKRKYLPGSETEKPREEDYRKIPEDVRIYVWRRDEGKCRKCGSKEKLEYDHIIPVSKGGSNTARNIELLCEKCNREKSANIG